METYSNRVANFFLSKGYSKGDTIALFMENRPEYVATWLGLAKIGVIPALINYNLSEDSLLHTVEIADCCAIIYGLELEKGKWTYSTPSMCTAKKKKKKMGLALCLYSTVKTFTSLHASTIMVVVNGRSSGA